MSVNSSSNSTSSLLHPPPDDCLKSSLGFFIFTSFFISSILLTLPMFILIFFVSLRRWRKQRSVSMAATMSHSDFFTYNVVALELMSYMATFFYLFGTRIHVQSVKQVGEYICSITSPGETMFHLLTCVERYLAVVHPITYLGLRQAGGVRIRNMSSGCVWLLCIVSLCINQLFDSDLSSITVACFLVFSLIVVSFCSLSVLSVLIRSGPREVGGNRERVVQSKQRAFHTIVAILGALVFRFVGVLLFTVMNQSSVLTDTVCVVGMSAAWLTLPCSLVLPLLFLQRAGKLPSCKHSTESG